MSDIGKSVLRGAKEALEFAEGDASKAKVHIPHEIDVKRIRKKLGLTQKGFCDTYGLDISAVRDWEQGRRVPERSARILLKVIDRAPKTVERAVWA